MISEDLLVLRLTSTSPCFRPPRLAGVLRPWTCQSTKSSRLKVLCTDIFNFPSRMIDRNSFSARRRFKLRIKWVTDFSGIWSSWRFCWWNKFVLLTNKHEYILLLLMWGILQALCLRQCPAWQSSTSTLPLHEILGKASKLLPLSRASYGSSVGGKFCLWSTDGIDHCIDRIFYFIYKFDQVYSLRDKYAVPFLQLNGRYKFSNYWFLLCKFH